MEQTFTRMGRRDEKRDADKCQDSNRLVNRERERKRERILRVCLGSSTASALTKRGRSRLRRPAWLSHSKPAVNQPDDNAPKL